MIKPVNTYAFSILITRSSVVAFCRITLNVTIFAIIAIIACAAALAAPSVIADTLHTIIKDRACAVTRARARRAEAACVLYKPFCALSTV